MKTLLVVHIVHNQILNTKKAYFLFVVIFLFTAQMQSQISLGGGLGYNQKISAPGITLKGEFSITDQIAISGSASYFFGNRLYGYQRNLVAGDINVHYFFDIIESKLKIYPIVGANFSSYKTGETSYNYFLFTTSSTSNKASESAFGGNLGVGARWRFSNKLSIYLEPKYIVSNYSQFVVNAGVLIKLK